MLKVNKSSVWDVLEVDEISTSGSRCILGQLYKLRANLFLSSWEIFYGQSKVFQTNKNQRQEQRHPWEWFDRMLDGIFELLKTVTANLSCQQLRLRSQIVRKKGQFWTEKATPTNANSKIIDYSCVPFQTQVWTRSLKVVLMPFHIPGIPHEQIPLLSHLPRRWREAREVWSFFLRMEAQ